MSRRSAPTIILALLLAGAGWGVPASVGQAQTTGTTQTQALPPDQSGLQTGNQLRLYFQLPQQGGDGGDPDQGYGPRNGRGARNGYGYGYDQPPTPQPPPPRCRDYGSFAGVVPSPPRGAPIGTQFWNDCADLPGTGAPQPQIGAEIQISPQSPSPTQPIQPFQGQSQGGQQGVMRGPARLRLQ